MIWHQAMPKKTKRQRMKVFLALLILPLCLIGCATASGPKLTVNCRMAGVENGDIVFVVSINGQTFEHKSSNGGIEFFKNRTGSIFKVRVWSGRGTYIGGEVDYYYHIGKDGQITFLGNLKESWYEDEDFIRVRMSGFHPVTVFGYGG
jgi:hypothetical protein